MSYYQITKTDTDGWKKDLIDAAKSYGPTRFAHNITMAVPICTDNDSYYQDSETRADLIVFLRDLIKSYGARRVKRVFMNDLGKNEIVAEDHFIRAILDLLF